MNLYDFYKNNYIGIIKCERLRIAKIKHEDKYLFSFSLTENDFLRIRKKIINKKNNIALLEDTISFSQVRILITTTDKALEEQDNNNNYHYATLNLTKPYCLKGYLI